MSEPTQPLADITVLDLSQVYNGPYAAFLMANAGAEVIKVEPPGGEFLRLHAAVDLEPAQGLGEVAPAREGPLRPGWAPHLAQPPLRSEDQPQALQVPAGARQQTARHVRSSASSGPAARKVPPDER